MFEDLRYALRSLVKHRAVVLVAVLSLALGIGANTTIFTLVNAVLLRPLPVEDPARLAAVSTVDSRNPGFVLCSYPNYKDFRDRNQVFSSLLLHAAVTINLTGRGDPQLLMGELVSGNYFSALGVNPVVGRGFLPEEDATPGAWPVAVLSYGLWRQQFGGDPQVTSRTISLNGRAFQIVGVAPPGFHGLNELFAADVWVPMMMYPQVYPNAAWVNQRRFLGFSVAGRLKPGVSFPQAEAAIRSIAAELEREYPKDNAGRSVRLSPVSEAVLAPKTRATVRQCRHDPHDYFGTGDDDRVRQRGESSAGAGAGAQQRDCGAAGVGSGPMAAHPATPHREHRAFGIGRRGGAGGGAGGRADLVWSLRPPMFTHSGVNPELDGRVLAYSLAVSILTGILFGLVPALRATRADLASDLKERAAQPGSSMRAWSLRSVLVSGQVAFSLIALVGAGLFVRSIRNAARIDPGFDASHLGMVAFNVGDQGYNEARGRDYQSRVLELAAATPGVISAALSKDPAFRVSSARTVLLEGQENTVSGTGRITLTSVVGPGYFQTAGIPLLRGRDFRSLDTPGTPRVAIVNEFAAAHFWPGQEAVGKRIHFFGDSVPAEVVGVARTPIIWPSAKSRNLSSTSRSSSITFRRQWCGCAPAAIRRRWHRRCGTRCSRWTATCCCNRRAWSARFANRLWAQRFSAGLLTVFGGLALLLATIGIYGVVSYSVHQRAREIGVRMALGATAGDVQMMIVLEGFRLVATGVVVGTVTALVAARLVQSMLFAISARDAMTFVLVPSLMGLVAIVACWVPAMRATRIDPSAALREE